MVVYGEHSLCTVTGVTPRPKGYLWGIAGYRPVSGSHRGSPKFLCHLGLTNTFYNKSPGRRSLKAVVMHLDWVQAPYAVLD